MKKQIHPLIGIPADRFFHADYLWHGAAHQYVHAAAHVAKVTPVIIPAMHDLIDLDSLMENLDGILISGARSNVHPDYYGHEATPQHEPFDRARDSLSLPLIRAAIEKGLPLLAICRGIQELNVALGGTLHSAVHTVPGRDIHYAPKSDNPDVKFSIRQNIHIEADSCLAAIVGSDDIQVNSVHYQGIDQLADELQVEAYANDGVIEAVSVKNAKDFALGVQWHPEYWAQTDMPSRQLFEAFGQAVYRHYHMRHTS